MVWYNEQDYYWRKKGYRYIEIPKNVYLNNSYHLDNKQFTLDGRPSDYGAEDDIQISSYAGWGVCGKTCDESLETVIFGTVYNMHIFMQFYLGSTDWNS